MTHSTRSARQRNLHSFWPASATKWLSGNAWVGFVVGLGLFATAIWWPEMEPRLSRLAAFIPITTGERLRIIEAEHLPSLLENHAIFRQELAQIEKIHEGAEREHGYVERNHEQLLRKCNTFMAGRN